MLKNNTHATMPENQPTPPLTGLSQVQHWKKNSPSYMSTLLKVNSFPT